MAGFARLVGACGHKTAQLGVRCRRRSCLTRLCVGCLFCLISFFSLRGGARWDCHCAWHSASTWYVGHVISSIALCLSCVLALLLLSSSSACSSGAPPRLVRSGKRRILACVCCCCFLCFARENTADVHKRTFARRRGDAGAR